MNGRLHLGHTFTISKVSAMLVMALGGGLGGVAT